MRTYERMGEEYAMNIHKFFPRNCVAWMLTCAFIFLFSEASISHGTGPLLAWPVAGGGSIQSKSTEALNPHEMRKGRIALAPEILPKPAGAADHRAAIAPSKGDDDTVSVHLFSDVSYDVIVDSVNYHADGTMIIHGKLKDHKIGTVVMTIGPDGFLITVQDMKKGLLYRAEGDSRQGSGTVTEIDMTKMPPMIR
jgi:hypothetical protein